VKLILEVSGGFTGPVGKQVITLDLAQLAKTAAEKLRHELEHVPETAWGASFFSSHPKSWDFRYLLRVEENDKKKQVIFNRNEGPPELTRLAETIISLDPTSK
jgi:hypothetical protein